jgi:hypothetical protein
MPVTGKMGWSTAPELIPSSWQAGKIEEPAWMNRNFPFGGWEGPERSDGPDTRPLYLTHAVAPWGEERQSNAHETGRFP